MYVCRCKITLYNVQFIVHCTLYNELHIATYQNIHYLNIREGVRRKKRNKSGLLPNPHRTNHQQSTFPCQYDDILQIADTPTQPPNIKFTHFFRRRLCGLAGNTEQTLESVQQQRPTDSAFPIAYYKLSCTCPLSISASVHTGNGAKICIQGNLSVRLLPGLSIVG